MEEQSGREFASADPRAGAQDATLQERRLGPEVPLNPRAAYNTFNVQRHLTSASISPRATRRGDDRSITKSWACACRAAAIIAFVGRVGLSATDFRRLSGARHSLNILLTIFIIGPAPSNRRSGTKRR